LLALLGYFLLALLVTYPVAAQFTSGVPGDLVADRDQNLWNLWWVKESLFAFNNPFHTDMLYYPYGADLYYHTLALPLGLIGLIPQLLSGLPAAYNTVLLVGFMLSGYGMFRILDFGFWILDLSRVNPKSKIQNPIWIGAFLGGVVFAFTPYTLDALKGQPEVLSLQWIPLFAEMWLRATKDEGRRTKDGKPHSALAGVFLALAAYSNLYYAVYLVVFVVAYVAYRLVVARRGGLEWEVRALARTGVVTGMVALVLGLPLLMGLVAHRNDPRLAVEADPAHRLAHSADLLSFFVPPHDHVLFGTWQDMPGVNEPPIHDYVGLGYVALALAVLGAVVAWRRPGVRFWVGLMVVALVLAMGPELQVGRNRTGVPLPFALLEWLPGMDAIAKPERFVVLARLCMGVLAGWGVVWLVAGRRTKDEGRMWGDEGRRTKEEGNYELRITNYERRSANEDRVFRPRYSWLGILLLLGLLVELPIHPRYMERVADLPFYGAYGGLAGEPLDGLMELPFATQQSETTGRRMLLQTVHEKPIMSGYLARRYDSPIIDSCGPFWGFISPLDVPREDIASPLVANRPLDVLGFYDIHYMTLYSNFTGAPGDEVDSEQFEALEAIVDEVKQETIFAGNFLNVYKVRQADTVGAIPSFHVGAGWYASEQSAGNPFRWVKDGHGSLCVFSPRDVTGSLVMEGTAFAQERAVTLAVGGETLYSGKFSAGNFTSINTGVREWQAGVTQVDISALEAGSSPNSLDPNAGDDRVLTVGFRSVVLEERERK
jgi:hypothetical protein